MVVVHLVMNTYNANEFVFIENELNVSRRRETYESHMKRIFNAAGLTGQLNEEGIYRLTGQHHGYMCKSVVYSILKKVDLSTAMLAVEKEELEYFNIGMDPSDELYYHNLDFTYWAHLVVGVKPTFKFIPKWYEVVGK
jgi:hypothetical protein